MYSNTVISNIVNIKPGSDGQEIATLTDAGQDTLQSTNITAGPMTNEQTIDGLFTANNDKSKRSLSSQHYTTDLVQIPSNESGSNSVSEPKFLQKQIQIRDDRQSVTITVEVDNYYTEAAWNVWVFPQGYYFGTHQTFSYEGDMAYITLNLPVGNHYVHCWDSYGDGGISGHTSGASVNASWDADDYTYTGQFGFQNINYQPDLTVDNLSVSPSSLQPGEQIHISYRYRNIGNTSAGSARTYFFLSNDQVFGDTDDFQLGYITESNISSGSSRNIQRSFYIPQGTTSGTRYVYVRVDGNDIIDESNENNNVAGPSNSFNIFNPWIMEVSPTSYNFGSVRVGDNSSTHQFTFTNTGGSSCSVTFELDDGDHFDITSGGGTYNLAPGSSRSVYVRFEPQSTGYKTDYLDARVGSTFATSATLNGTGLAALPDLTINNLSVSPSEVQPGEIIEIDYRYRNIGNGHSGSARTYFYLSNDQVFGDTDDFQLGYVTENSIQADTYIDRVRNFYIPQDTSSGTRYLYAKVDGSDIIEESNESNNTAGPSNSFSIVNPWVIEVSPTSYNFGDVYVGDNSSNYQFTFTNIGGSSCTAVFELDDSDHFEILSGGGTYTLNPGSSRNVSVRFTPQSTGYKTDYLAARVGSTFATTATLNGTGLAALPDLTVDNISFLQSSVYAGERFNLSYRLRNLGEGESGLCLTRFILSDDLTYGDNDDILVAQVTEDPITATTNVNCLVENILVPQGTPAGHWYIYVFVDATEGMDESNENNNLGVSASTISVIGIPDPPVALEADNVTIDGFRARWNSVPNATSYSLDVSMSINFDSFVSGYNGYSVSGTNHTLSELNVGTDYYYRVRAVNSAGSSTNSNIVYLSTEYSPIPMIHLSVPYYRQMRALWCGLASLSMLSKFTGVMDKSKQWNLAAILNQPADGATVIEGFNNYHLVSTLEQSSLDNFNWVTGHVWTRNSIKNKTIEIISSGKPIMWGGSGHGRVITGISPYGVWVNDPGSSHFANEFHEWDDFLNYYEAVTPISVLATYFYVDAPQASTANNLCFNMDYSLDNVNSTFDTYYAVNKYGNDIHKLGYDVDGTENEYGYFYKKIDSQTPSWHPIDAIFQRKFTLADVIHLEPEVLSYSAPSYAPFFLRAKVYLNETLIEEFQGSICMLTQERDYLESSEYTNIVSSGGGISFEASSLIGESIYDLELELVDNNTASVLDRMKFKLPIASSQYASFDFMNSSDALEVSYGSNTMFSFSITNLGSQSDSFRLLSYPTNSYLNATVSIDPSMIHESHIYLDTAELPAGSEGELYLVIQSQNDPNKKKLLAIPYIVSQSSPIALLATDISQTNFQANWEASPGATSYLLDVSRNESFSSYVTGYHNKPVSGTNQMVTGLYGGLTYYYRVRALNGSILSPYSNSISVVTSFIKVTAPNTNISWQVNTTQQISWNSASQTGNVTIDLVKGPYNTHIRTISSSPSINTGFFNWSIPGSISQASDYRIKITSNLNPNLYDLSDNYFTINQPPSLTVSSPDEGEVWYKGQRYEIRWTQNLIPGNVRIQLHRGTSSTILSTPSSSISASEEVLYWNVPTTLTNATNYRLRVISIDTPSVYADSPYFSIQSNPGVLAAPVNAQIIRLGNTVFISWNSVSGATSYRIESSANATGQFMQVGNTSNTTWSTTDSSNRRFYRIIATN